ncbi:MAG: GNAT family N-acetyltransferase [Ferruginibacter sp.]
MKIQHLSYHDIDLQKWDDCIKGSAHPLIYAQSICLNQMCGKWEALVLNNYETVMPLTYKIKWGIRYLYQPAFIAQMGIFGRHAEDKMVCKGFINKILELYRFLEIPFHFSNIIPSEFEKYTVSRNNFILDLNHSYDIIVKNISSSHTKNIKRAGKFSLNYQIEKDPFKIIQLFKKLYNDRELVYQSKDYVNFEILCKKLATQQQLVLRKVTNGINEMVAGIILLKDEHRLYNVMSCVTTEGKKTEANYLLFQQLIQEFCQQDLILDFEGSDVKGIASFYQQFGAINEPYPFIGINRLPGWVKLFKR